MSVDHEVAVDQVVGVAHVVEGAFADPDAELPQARLQVLSLWLVLPVPWRHRASTADAFARGFVAAAGMTALLTAGAVGSQVSDQATEMMTLPRACSVSTRRIAAGASSNEKVRSTTGKS